jgi:beta-glucosidase
MGLSVSVDVQNVGKRDGEEVVQLYVHDVQCSVKRPITELRGFERISLQPGEKRTVTFTLKGEQLGFYDVNKHDFVVEPGMFDVLVGSSSDDIRLAAQFKVE